MNDEQTDQSTRRSLANVWRAALAIVGIIAVVGELRRPPAERTWHGTVAGFIPYDFRMPTAERLRETYWNPDGPIISSKLWGVGWALNLGAVKRRIGD